MNLVNINGIYINPEKISALEEYIHKPSYTKPFRPNGTWVCFSDGQNTFIPKLKPQQILEMLKQE